VLLCHDRWRREAWRKGPFLAMAALVMGLLSGEAALSVGGYLFAYALFVDESPLHRRWTALLPYAAVAAGWAAIYLHFGLGTRGSNGYADPGTEPIHFLSNVASHLPVMLFGVFSPPDCTVYSFLPGPLAFIYWTACVLGIGVMAWLFWPILRGNRWAGFWALGMILSALPACGVAVQSRLLGYPGLGGMALLALFIHRAVAPVDGPNTTRLWDRAARVAVPVVLGIHLILSPVLLSSGSYMIRWVEEGGQRANASLPNEPRIENETIVLVNVLSDLIGIGLPVIRSSLGQSVPQHTWMLSASDEDVRVERVDEHSIVVTLEGGYLKRPWADLFRRPSLEPMMPGDKIRLTGLEAEILSVCDDGRPRSVKFRFDMPLQDSSLHWFAWSGGQFVPFKAPEIGHSETLSGTTFAQLIGFGRSRSP